MASNTISPDKGRKQAPIIQNKHSCLPSGEHLYLHPPVPGTVLQALLCHLSIPFHSAR